MEGGRLATDELHNGNGAIKGAPKDFSKVTTFGIAPKTVGKFTVAVDGFVANK